MLMTGFEKLPAATREEVAALAKLGTRHPDPELSTEGRGGSAFAMLFDVVAGVLLGGGGGRPHRRRNRETATRKENPGAAERDVALIKLIRHPSSAIAAWCVRS
jgi:hypothetical protein